MHSDNVTNILKQIESILRSFGETRWLPAIENFISQLSSHAKNDDQRVIARKIMRMYGGMGSFTDLVLFDGGNVYDQENEQLDTLRRELYELCVTIITDH